MAGSIHLAVGQFSELSQERLQFIAQLGVENVLLNTPELPGERQWEFMDLLHLRTRCNDAGLSLVALENVPIKFYDKIMLGLPGRDDQIARMATTIQNMGRAGIHILGYHWMPNRVWRTSRTTRGRGGALVTSFDMRLAEQAPLSFDREYTEGEMWDSFEYYITRILPVAEKAGVKLALHPDDPPVESLGGVARIFRNFDGFRQAMVIGDSPSHGLDFCHGCWSEMGAGALDALRYFSAQGKVEYIHFRDVQGTVPRFQECFVDEGNNSMVDVIRTLLETGFDGFLIPDHVPHMAGDSQWGHRGRAYAIGYMTALLEALDTGSRAD